jgi:AsmA-like protein/uncharacterized protein DUF3971
MKKITRRAALITMEVLALLLAALAGLGFFLYWKASHGGLDLAIAKPTIEAKMAKRLGADGKVSIGKITLQRTRPEQGNKGPFRLIFDDLVYQSGDKQEDDAHFSRFAVRFETGDLMRGNFQPRFVEIFDANVTLIRNADGRFDYGLRLGGGLGAGSPGENGTGDVTSPFLLDLFAAQGGSNPGTFEGAIIDNASFVFRDGVSGQVWQAEGMTLVAEQLGDGGYQLKLDVPLQYDGVAAHVKVAAFSRSADDRVNATMKVDKVPAGELFSIFVPDNHAFVREARLSGDIDFTLDNKGQIEEAKLDLTSDGGVLHMGQFVTPFDSLAYQGKFITATRSFVFDQLHIEAMETSGSLEGYISFGRSNEDDVEFAIASNDLTLAAMNIFEAPINLNDLDIAGVYQPGQKIARFDKARWEYGGAKFDGEIAVQWAASEIAQELKSPGIKTKGTVIGGVNVEKLIGGWPLEVAPEARLWVKENIHQAEVSDIVFALDIPVGAIVPVKIEDEQDLKIRDENPLDDDMVDVRFAVDDARATYLPGMAHLENLRGTGRLRGNGLSLKLQTGTVGGMIITGGEVDMPIFLPRGGPGYYRAQVTGPVREGLSLLNQKPLQLFAQSRLSPDMFSGTGSFSLEIMRPMREVVSVEEMSITGTGSFEDVSVIGLMADRDIEEAKGNIRLARDRLMIDADGQIAATPVRFTWDRPLDDRKIGEMRFSGMMDTVTADSYGFSVRQFLRGALPYAVTLRTRGEETVDIAVSADLTNTEINPGFFSWRKPKGDQGSLSLRLIPPGKEDVWRVEDFELRANEMSLIGYGRADKDGKFLSAAVEKYYVKDRADFSMEAKRNPAGDLTVTLRGKRADASGLVTEILRSGSEGKLPGGFTLDVNLETLFLNGKASLSPFTASLRHDGEAMQAVNIMGNFSDNSALSMELRSDGSELGRKFIVQFGNLAQLVEGLFGIDSIRGGVGRFDADLFRGGTMAGQFNAEGVTIVRAPLIARILSAGSLDGLGKLLNNEGITFSAVASEIVFAKDLVSFNKTRATGPSLGISLEGNINLASKEFDLNGALAPAYQFNSMLGNIPGLGEILVSREGEGVVAFTYTVSGPIAEPTVTVNTLSALAPGIFRRMFDPLRQKRPTTEELLEEAINAVEDQLRDDIPTVEIEELPTISGLEEVIEDSAEPQ